MKANATSQTHPAPTGTAPAQRATVKSFKGFLSRTQAKRIFRDGFLREVTVNYQPRLERAFTIREPGQVAVFVRRVLADNSREHLIALYLDSAHQVASFSVVSIGTVNHTLVHPREIFQRALGAGAVALVLAHNHPSGKTQPSPEDIAVTRQIKEAGQILGIKLLDHVIVAEDEHYSFEAEQML